MARLPNPGGDEGTWGNVLNDFLSTIHNNDGTLKDNTVSSSALAPDAVDSSNIQDATISEDKLDAALAAKVNTIGSSPDATTSTKGIVQLAGDLGGTATAPTVPGLAAKANDAAVVHLAGGETLTGVKAFSASPTVPTPTTDTQAANKLYVDNTVAGAVVPDATTSSKGIVQLAGDLGGTAASPTVPGLATKEPTITAGTTGQYYRGDKSWQTLDKTAVGLSNVDNTSDINKPISSATQTALNAKADASAVGAKVLLIDNAAALPPGTPADVIVVVKS